MGSTRPITNRRNINMSDTLTFVVLGILAVYTACFSYVVFNAIENLRDRDVLRSVNYHAYADYVEENLQIVHDRVDDLASVRGSHAVTPSAVKAVNTGRSVAKKAAPAKKAVAKKVAEKKAASRAK